LARDTQYRDSQYIDIVKSIGFTPFFILGDHRSGTTLLYKLLSQTKCFNIVTAYHVIRYQEILANHLEGKTEMARGELAASFAELGIKDRVIDGMKVTPDFPEEYGFVIDSGSRPQLNEKTRPKFVELCSKVQFTGDAARPLLLKNPWDSLRFPYIKKVFPACRFVFIHRHPAAIINSQMQSIRSLLASRNGYAALTARWYRDLFDSPIRLAGARLLFSTQMHLLERIVARHILRVVSTFMQNRGLLTAKDCLSLRYEDLCQDPDGNIRRALDFLGVQHRPIESYQGYIDRRTSKLLPEANSAFQRIGERLRPYLALHGYEMRWSPASP